MNLDETQALDLGQYDDSDDEQEPRRNRKLVGHLKVFKQQDFEEKVYKIYEGENFIGRDESSDVYIPRKSLSKSHACIEVADNLHLIYDNGSKNKTRRDKVVLRPQVRYELKTGDMLTLADLTLQYFIGDIPQVDDNDGTGSETGSESMLPIDAAAHDVAEGDDSSKVYAANTDSDTDDERNNKQSISNEAQGSTKTNDKPTADEVYKPKVPNVLYDSNDDDDEIITRPEHDVIPHQDEDHVLNVSSEGGTLAFGLVNPTDRPFIRPTTKHAVKETPATLLYSSDSQDTKTFSHFKSSTPATLLYSSDTQDNSPAKATATTTQNNVESTPATLLYGTDTQDKSPAKSTATTTQNKVESTPATLLYATDTQDKSPAKSTATTTQNKVENTPATMMYDTDTEDHIQDSAERNTTPQKASENTPATMIYTSETQEKSASYSNLDETSDEIFLPETQGFTPNDVSICAAATQAYIVETPVGTEEKQPQISNIPESGDEDDSSITKVLTFDESATQAYTWNDSDATDDDNDDLMFQPTQAYPSNPQPEKKKDFSSDEHSNPDLYGITRPDKCNTTETIESKVSNEMNPVDKPAMTSDLDGMETQAYVASDEDVAISGKPDRHIVQPTLPYNMMETQAYDADSDIEKSVGKRGKTTENIEPALPYNMMETQAYDADSDEQDSDVEKSVGKQSKTTENIEPTLPYNMMETQAYEADSDGQDSDAEKSVGKRGKTTENIEPTLSYNMMETQAYDADSDVEKSVGKRGKTTENIEPTLPYNMMETQAYDADSDGQDSDGQDSDVEKSVGKQSKTTENIEPTLPYNMMETQAYDAQEESLNTCSRQPETSTETTNKDIPIEPTLPYDLAEAEKVEEEEKEEAAVILETQAYGAGDDSETDDETSEIPNTVARPSQASENREKLAENSQGAGDVMSNMFEATQAYGLDNQRDESIPDSDDVLSQEIPQAEINQAEDDTNNNSTTKGINGQKEKSVQEETEIIIRPARRGRGRVTQGESQQTETTKADDRNTKREKTSNAPKSTRSRRLVRHRKSEVESEEPPASVQEVPMLSQRKSSRKTMKQKQDEDHAEEKDDESNLDTTTRSRRSMRNENQGNDKEEMAASSVDAVPKSLRGKRTRGKAVKEDISQLEDDADETMHGTLTDSTASNEQSIAANAPKSSKGRRTRKKVEMNEDVADEKDTEKSEETAANLPKSSKGRRTRKNVQITEDVADDTFAEKSEETAANLPKSSKGRRTRKKVEMTEDVADETFAEKSEETAANLPKSSKERQTRRNVEITEEMTEDVADEKPPDITATEEHKSEEVAANLPKSSRGKQTRKSVEEVLQEMTEDVADEQLSDITVTDEHKSEEVAGNVPKSVRGKRSKQRTTARVQTESNQDVVLEKTDASVLDTTPKDDNKSTRTRRSTRNEHKNTNEEMEVPKPLKGRRTRKSTKDLTQEMAHKESVMDHKTEDLMVDSSEKAEESIPGNKTRKISKKSKEIINTKENNTSDENITDGDFQSSRSSRTRKTTENANKGPSQQGKKSESVSLPEDSDVTFVLTDQSLDIKDSEDDQFVFKGKSRGRKKGKQPKKLAKTEETFVEMDSEELSPLDTILSDKHQETTPTYEKKVSSNQDVSQTDSQSTTSSVGSRGRGKRSSKAVVKSEDLPTPSKKKKETNNITVIHSPSLRERKQAMPKVMFTGVTDKQAEKIVTSLGGTLEESIYECTHLITDKVRRTVKFLCGVARGQIIVLPTWLSECKKNKKFIDPLPYIVQDKAAEKMYSFSLKQSHEQALQRGLLEGYKIHVTKNVKPDPSQMKDIIQCAKGEYLPRMPRTKEDNVLIISCDDDHDACKQAIASGIPVYSAELLLTGILRQELFLDKNLLFVVNQDEPQLSSSNTGRKRRNESTSESSQSSSRSSKRKK